jgi:hypothetical protein
METVKNYLDAGYNYAGSSWARGYVSRKNYNSQNQPVYKSKSKNVPPFFFFAPSWQSTQYCKKIYLSK